jgi:hypothetical protein
VPRFHLLIAIGLVFLAGGLPLLWHERRNQPVTAADLQILERADALLANES